MVEMRLLSRAHSATENTLGQLSTIKLIAKIGFILTVSESSN